MSIELNALEPLGVPMEFNPPEAPKALEPPTLEEAIKGQMVPYESQTSGMNKLVPYDENIINIEKEMVPYDEDVIQGNEVVPYDENITNTRKEMVPYDEDIIQGNKIVLYDKNIENYNNKVLILYEKLNRSVLKLIEDRIIKDQLTKNA